MFRFAAAVAALFLLQGCFGYTVSDSPKERDTEIGHTLTGIAYKTFPVPLARARHAALRTLRHMGMTVTGSRKTEESGWFIHARHDGRDVKVELDPVDGTATRMRVIVSDGTPIFKDRETGTEIITRTQSALARPPGK